MDGGWTPPPTRPQRYCNPASLVVFPQLNPNTFLVPCYDFDLIWHAHQLFPKAYKNDTKRLLGKFLMALTALSSIPDHGAKNLHATLSQKMSINIHHFFTSNLPRRRNRLEMQLLIPAQHPFLSSAYYPLFSRGVKDEYSITMTV